MKKAIALCLTAAMAASLLAGCGSKTTETTAAAENKTETTAGAAAEEKKDEAAGVVKVIEYDLTDEQYAFGVDKDQPELLEQVSYKVEDYGVLTFPRPGTRQSITSAIRLAAATHNRLSAFERRAVKLESKMKEIRLVNRAKWLLIDRYNMSEEEAHKYIEKTAMDNCATRGEIAENIIRTYES